MAAIKGETESAESKAAASKSAAPKSVASARAKLDVTVDDDD